MRGVLQFSVYFVVCTSVRYTYIIFFFFCLFFSAPIHGTVVDACQDDAGTIGLYTGIYGVGVMFGYYVTQKWDKHISIYE